MGNFITIVLLITHFCVYYIGRSMKINKALKDQFEDYKEFLKTKKE